MNQEKLIGLIKEKYGSLDNPDRGFIDKIFETDPYKAHAESPLIKQLEKSFAIAR